MGFLRLDYIEKALHRGVKPFLILSKIATSYFTIFNKPLVDFMI